MYALTVIIVPIITVMKLDRNKVASDVTGGYAGIMSLTYTGVVPMVYQMASANVGSRLINTVMITSFGAMLLTLSTPICKRLFQENWVCIVKLLAFYVLLHEISCSQVFCLPPFLLALECGQVALLLGLKLTAVDLYITVFFQLSCKSCEPSGRASSFIHLTAAPWRAQTRFSNTQAYR